MRFALAALTVVAAGWATVTTAPTRHRLVKMIASTGFVAIAIAVGAGSTTHGTVMLVGFVLCWVGDLALTSERGFLAGLAAFLCGHVAFVAAFVVRDAAHPIVGFVIPAMAVVGFTVHAWLRPGLEGPFRFAVAAYIVVISAMVIAAYGTSAAVGDVRLASGATLFAASDIAVARNEFVAPERVNRLVGLPLYYAAQLLLAFGAGT